MVCDLRRGLLDTAMECKVTCDTVPLDAGNDVTHVKTVSKATVFDEMDSSENAGCLEDIDRGVSGDFPTASQSENAMSSDILKKSYMTENGSGDSASGLFIAHAV